MVDTHAHIYDEAFDNDRTEVIKRAKAAGVSHIVLPNVDSKSLSGMLKLEEEYSGYCFAAIGLHPTSVSEDYKVQLVFVGEELKRREYIAIGEIGIDLYWDKTYYKEQVFVFQQQIQWALEYDLPVIIHVRDSFRETMDALEPFRGKGLTGIFHSFTGDVNNANEIINYGGFRLGINGIVTFKNSNLSDVLKSVDLKYIVLETDAPYLTPVPYRGKRNESAYIQYVCSRLTEIYGKSQEEINDITTESALSVFKKMLKP